MMVLYDWWLSSVASVNQCPLRYERIVSSSPIYRRFILIFIRTAHINILYEIKDLPSIRFPILCPRVTPSPDPWWPAGKRSSCEQPARAPWGPKHCRTIPCTVHTWVTRSHRSSFPAILWWKKREINRRKNRYLLIINYIRVRHFEKLPQCTSVFQ